MKKSDAEVIADNILADMRPKLVAAIENLVAIGVRRKLDNARKSILDTFQVPA